MEYSKKGFLFIDTANSALKKEINFHPAYIYFINSLQNSNLSSRVDVYANSMDVVNEIKDYGFKSTNYVASKNEIDKGYLFELSVCFPLLSAETLNLVEQNLANSFQLSFSAINWKYQSENTKTINLTKPELLTVLDEIDFVFISAYIHSDFNKNHPIRFSPPYKIEHFKATGKQKMLFSAPYEFFSDELKQKISKLFDVTFVFNAPKEKVVELIRNAQVWITGTCPPYKIDKDILDSAAQLTLIATPSTGTNHIDTKEVERRNIKILSIKSSPVIEQIHASSEFSFSLLLAMINKVPFSCNAAKYGTWREQEHIFRSIELNGKTIGLIGYGRIGRKMARFANSFEMKVIAFDPFKEITDSYVTQVNSRKELLQKADIVSLHYHLTDETCNSFGASDFELMKDGAYFLNTARGELVDEQAMLNALKSGKLKAAAVDVITNEHIQEKWNHPVIEYARNNSNLLVSPHIAGCTIDSESKAMIDLLEQVIKSVNE